jgi:uncharacterized membrane protein YcfT
MRMPLFFLVSGLFAARLLAAPWRTVLHKRVAFFGYLYLIWMIIRFAFFASVVPPAVDPDEAASPVDLLWSVLLPGSGMWFLYALAVFAVVAKLMRPVPLWLQLGATGALSALVSAGLLEFADSRWSYLARLLFFFLLGCYAKPLVERLAAATSPLRVAVTAVVCVGAAGAAIVLGLRSMPGISLALQCLAAGFGVLFAAWISRYRLGRPLVLLGRQTLPVYLIHLLWLALIMTPLWNVDLPPVVTYPLPAVLTVVVTALSLTTHRLLVAAGATWLFELPPRLGYRPLESVPATDR